MDSTINNSHAEFERLAARYERQAYDMAYHLTGNRDDAEDLAQEGYLRAYRSLNTYDRTLPFDSWLYRILANLFIDSLRRKPKTMPLSLDQPMRNVGDGNMCLDIPDEESNPEVTVLHDMIGHEELLRALEAMPKEFREAVLLCDVEGFTYAEVGDVLGYGIGTIRSRIHRGRMMIRNSINGMDISKRRRKCMTS